MSMRHLRIILAVAALATLVALSGCGGAPSTPAGGTGGTGGTGGPASKAVSVSMKNTAFNPADITVAVGGTVTFANDDAVGHTVTGDGWDSGVMAAGATFSHTFDTAGTFPIRCTIHPSMTGTVNVK